MKKIRFMDTSFRDGFQSCLGARVKMNDFLPILEMAVDAGTTNFEIGGGARFQALYFYCQEDAFDMMDKAREIVGPECNLQTLSRGINVVSLSSCSRDIVDLHAKMFKKHGVSTIRNFDALNDVRNLHYSGERITHHKVNHQVVVTLMAQPLIDDTSDASKNYAHSSQFYIDRLRQILDQGVPFDSVCFKDASGTCTPKIVFETVTEARKLLGTDSDIEIHTHATAGIAVSCYMAAIEAGADIIDLAMSPVSGGTSQPDILTMWHQLRGTSFQLDIDYEKILKVEEAFEESLKDYFIGPEAKQVSPLISFSPMPGGALTANTTMMRSNNTYHRYPEVIKAMREVVEKGGYGTSVTPVSQFYFQQAFANVMQGNWKKITKGYGKMVLGYFGKTPVAPNPEIVKIASEQMGLPPTNEDPLDINDRNDSIGIDATKAILRKEGIEITDESLFIAAACEAKGIAFLKGDRPEGIEWVSDQEKKQLDLLIKKYPDRIPRGSGNTDSGHYQVTVDGQSYDVAVGPIGSSLKSLASQPKSSTDIHQQSSQDKAIRAPMPGAVVKILVNVGDSVNKNQTVALLEAMKMEIEVKVDISGTVTSINVHVGDTIDADQLIILVA